MKTFFGFGWAQPVKSHLKATWCSILEFVYRFSGGRILGHRKHMAWKRAVGVS